MENFEFCGEIILCANCAYANEYGVSEVHTEPGDPQPLSLIGIDYVLFSGVAEHSEYCTDEDRTEGCDCATTGFRWSSCEGCGTYGFTGEKFTSYRLDRNGLCKTFNASLFRVREARNNAERLATLAEVAEWRRIIAKRSAADKRFAIWLERTNAERLAASE